MTSTETAVQLKSKDSFIIRTAKDLSPKELGRLLIITENLYRISLLYTTTKRKFSVDHDSYLFSIVTDIRIKYLLNEKENFNEEAFIYNLELKFFDMSDIGHIYYVTDLLPEKLRIDIGSIQFNSPGRIDLLGLGEVIQQINNFIFEIIRFKHERRKRKLELEKYREELLRERLENVNRFLEITENHNLDFATANKLLRELNSYEEELYDLVLKGKLDSVEIVSNDQ